jgi:hypothetical protein
MSRAFKPKIEVNAVRDLPKARRLSRSLSIPASNRSRG